MSNDIYIGALSGTSMDAIDVAAVRLPVPHRGSISGNIELLAYADTEIPQRLRRRIRQLQKKDVTTPAQAAPEHHSLGQLFADAVKCLVERQLNGDDARAIGLHGQTLLHRPHASSPFTLQLADPQLVATQTNYAVVSDFRQSDLAVGGQGAPLAPAFHQALFARSKHCVAVVNIGGISNVTHLDGDRDYSGYDCGPGNILLDAWIKQQRDADYDHDGDWARAGTCDPALLEQLLDHPFFKQTPPKSACATMFGMDWLKQQLAASAALPAQDVQASLLELTACCIADSIHSLAPAPEEILVCGGGAHNRYLMERLQTLCKMCVRDTQAVGVPARQVEAVGFAYLAQRRLHHIKTDLRRVTGAREAAILGTLYEP